MQALPQLLNFVEIHVPKSLQLCDSFFTQFVLCSDVGVSSYMNKDEKDLMISFITIGDGGKTRYYSGKSVSTANNIIHEVKFKHGQIQIGQFNNVLYDVEQWKGTRLTLVLNLKFYIVEHLKELSSKYYNESEKYK